MKTSIRQKLDRYNLTDFQKQVLAEVCKIPKGETRTYKELAIGIGNKNAYRAAGTAVSKNPMAPIIPCHRVVRSDGTIGSYSGKGGKSAKARLLKREGAL